MRRYCNKKAGFASGFFIVCRLLALEAVVVVWQFALTFAAIRQADFQETIANHEGEVAGVVVQLKVFFVGSVAVEATGGVVFRFFAEFGGLDGVVAAGQGQADLQAVAVGAGQNAVVGAEEGGVVVIGSRGLLGRRVVGNRGRGVAAAEAEGGAAADDQGQGKADRGQFFHGFSVCCGLGGA